MKKNFKKRFLTGVAAAALIAPLVLGGISNPNAHAANTSSAAHEESMIHSGQLKNGMLGATNPNANANNGNSTASSQKTTTNNNSSNSGQLAAIKAQIQAQETTMQNNLTQARKKYQSLSKAQQKAQLKTMDDALQKQQKPIQQKIQALQKQYNNTMTPQQRKQAQDKQKAAQQKMMKQIQAQMKAQQKKEQKQMLKTAQTIFVTQGKKVYTLQADITKNKDKKTGKVQEQLQPIPGINKKYYSTTKAFGRKQAQEFRRAQAIELNARKLRSKRARAAAVKKANNIILKYERMATLPTKKQQEAIAKQQKKSQNQKNGKKTTKKSTRKSRTKRSRKSRKTTRKNRKRKSTRRSRKNKRTRKAKTNQRKRTFTRTVNGNQKVSVLKSNFRRGSHKNAVKKAGFATEPTSNGIHIMFNRYAPNDRRAIVPKNYKIYTVSSPKYKNATTWLVGRKTNNANKIKYNKQSYYYNNNYGGWLNIGYTNQQPIQPKKIDK